MKTMIYAAALVALFFVTSAMADGGWSGDRPFVGSFSGTSVPAGIDRNDDGELGTHQHWTGRATYLGRFTFTSAAEGYPWDGASLCDPSTEPYPTEVKLLPYYHSGVLTAWNGDQIHVVVDEGPGTALCFNFVDFKSFYGTSRFRIVGGTGRFENATGYFEADYTGTTIPNAGGISAANGFTGKFSGELILGI